MAQIIEIFLNFRLEVNELLARFLALFANLRAEGMSTCPVFFVVVAIFTNLRPERN